MLSAGFGLMTAGTLLAYSGWTNNSIADVLQGLAVPKGGAGAGFVAMISGAGSGVREGATPRSGGAGPPAGKAPAGLTTFDGQPICRWVAAELRWARKHGWTGSLTSGYRSTADQARVCAEVPPGTPCAAPGESNHQGKRYPKCAADVTEAAQLDRVLSRKRGRRLKWTGPQANDEPHFSSGLNGV